MDMLGRMLNLAATVRGKILLGFVLMSTMTCLLGLAGMNSIGDAGSAVAENFNRPLASISYARIALARFTEMQTRLTRQLSTGPMRPQGGAEIWWYRIGPAVVPAARRASRRQHGHRRALWGRARR
jgi:hypothetical protein